MAFDRSEFLDRLPNHRKKFVNKELLDMIERIEQQDEAEGTFVDMVVDNETVMGKGRYKAASYINACRFVSHYLQTEKVQESYDKTFPEKALDRIARGVSASSMSNSASMYLKGTLVQQILAQSQVGLNVFHARKRHKAVERLYDLMENSKSEKIQLESADRLLTHLKDPEQSMVELQITDSRGDYTNDLENKMKALAQEQLKVLTSGMVSAKEIIESSIIEVAENE
jgi:hypothetical protein